MLSDFSAKFFRSFTTFLNSFDSSEPSFWTSFTSLNTLRIGSNSRLRRSLTTCLARAQTSFSDLKYSFLSPGTDTLYIICQSRRARIFMLALPREILSSSMISSVLRGFVEIISKAWIWAIVLFSPQLYPRFPHAWINSSFASLYFIRPNIAKVTELSVFIESLICEKMRLCLPSESVPCTQTFECSGHGGNS